jgi:hypothetical protein
MNKAAAEAQSLSLMARHGLTQPRWSFCWCDSLEFVGLCCRFPSDRGGFIRLSHPWAQANYFSPRFVDAVILHEVAHALVGPARMHDEVWLAKCLEIGGCPWPVDTFISPMPPKELFLARAAQCMRSRFFQLQLTADDEDACLRAFQRIPGRFFQDTDAERSVVELATYSFFCDDFSVLPQRLAQFLS